MSVVRRYVVASTVVAVLVLLAGWFLVVGPQRGEAAELSTRAADQESANSNLRVRLEVLRQQAEDLPAQQARLADIATKIPADADLPTLVRQLTDAAAAAGVELTAVEPAPPQPVGAAGAAPVPADPAAAAGAAAAPVPGSAASDLAVVPVSLTVEGGYFQIEEFFSNLELMPRAVLVGEFTLEAAQDGAGSSSALTAKISGQVFLSPSVSSTPAASTVVDGDASTAMLDPTAVAPAP